jgi:hypothetical protein
MTGCGIDITGPLASFQISELEGASAPGVAELVEALEKLSRLEPR